MDSFLVHITTNNHSKIAKKLLKTYVSQEKPVGIRRETGPKHMNNTHRTNWMSASRRAISIKQKKSIFSPFVFHLNKVLMTNDFFRIVDIYDFVKNTLKYQSKDVACLLSSQTGRRKTSQSLEKSSTKIVKHATKIN